VTQNQSTIEYEPIEYENAGAQQQGEIQYEPIQEVITPNNNVPVAEGINQVNPPVTNVTPVAPVAPVANNTVNVQGGYNGANAYNSYAEPQVYGGNIANSRVGFNSLGPNGVNANARYGANAGYNGNVGYRNRGGVNVGSGNRYANDQVYFPERQDDTGCSLI
jgi:hypothetical protein